MTYRKADLKDVEQIAGLMIKLHKEDTFELAVEIAKDAMKNGQVFFVCLDGEKIIGYVYGTVRRDYVEGSEQFEDPKVGYIESLYVLPKYRREGVARRLCKMLEDWAGHKGCTEFASDAYASNRRSRAFHKAIGFTESKPIVHFIKKTAEPAEALLSYLDRPATL